MILAFCFTFVNIPTGVLVSRQSVAAGTGALVGSGRVDAIANRIFKE